MSLLIDATLTAALGAASGRVVTVLNKGDIMTGRSRTTIQAACTRWNATYIEWSYSGDTDPLKHQYDQVLAYDNGPIMCLDADVIVHENCPDPFAYVIPGGVSWCRDIYSDRADDAFGSATHGGNFVVGQTVGVDPRCIPPINGGMVIFDEDADRNVVNDYKSWMDTYYRNSWESPISQCFLAGAVVKRQVPYVMMPQRFNQINIRGASPTEPGIRHYATVPRSEIPQ